MKPTSPKRPNRIALEIPPPLREGLRAQARRTGRTESELIREAIAEWLQRQVGEPA